MDGALTTPAGGGVEVLERLRELPGGPELLALAAGREDIELVGGAVRDLLLGNRPRELDVVVADDAPALAGAVAERLGGEAAVVHERFGTALVEHGPARLDFATRRAESYPAPGALPEVRPGTPQEDLARRDFTVNAIAVPLGGPQAGELRPVAFALEDLAARRLRVLHEASFRDDPTRLLRLARYRARLAFAVESDTAGLARRALANGVLGTVSGARLGAELRLALAEAAPVEALGAMEELGILAALHPRLRLERPVVERALALLPADGRRQALLLAALTLPLALRADGQPGEEIRALLDRLEFPHGERERVLAAAVAAVRLVEELPACERPAELYAVASGVPVEGVVLAAALDGSGRGRGSGVAEAAGRWLGELRYVELEIGGEELVAAGIPEGPEVGRRLRETLLMRLNGELADGRAAELAAALELD